jgi:hypothetical protein
MAAREPVGPEYSRPWRASLIPLQGSAAEIKIEVTETVGRLMAARCMEPLESGTPVRIDAYDAIQLGEIVACREEARGEYALLIERTETLSGLSNLRNIVNALLGEAQAGEPVHPLDRSSNRRPGAERRVLKR